MTKHKNLIISILLLLFSCGVSATPFEGVIYFKKTSGSEHTYFRYYIKGDNVRIEDVNEEGQLNGILLIDMTKVSLKMLSCSAQLYIEVPISPSSEQPRIKVDRTGEVKMIAGQECELWKALDTQDYTRFEFWVHEDNYPFFSPMLRMLNRKDKIAKAWIGLLIGDTFFPFEGIEYSSTGKEVTRLEVIELKPMELDPDLFTIPSNYSLFERRINN